MRWTRGGRSRNLEDRRGTSSRSRRGTASIGLGGALLLLVLSFVFDQNLFTLLGEPGASLPTAPGDSRSVPADVATEEEGVEFVSFVLDDAQQTWAQLFARSGQRYQDARLVLFRDAVRSACGFADAATGPFYCPGDSKVYIDLGFYDELRERFGAPGDFAQAYVLAHEIGHHVQNLLGIEQQTRRAQRGRPDTGNQLSVLMELQADCFAGVWGHSTAQRDILEHGDVEEGLAAAAAIGDDRLQRQSSGYVNPEAFTHGSSEQRVRWFRRGLSSGEIDECDTFADR